ncbi:hypothetical protein [Neolewinella sp.]|uniref:hypothetical protein n=1 Tax=Neolewinella sp. TaxID=2993543 RepID=UPI003B5216A1
MHPVLQHLIDTDFSDLQGSSVEGQFVVTDELVNLGLHELVSQLTKPASATSTAPAAPPASQTTELPDPKLLLRKVKIEHLQYRTEAGRTVLEIKAGV